MNTLFDGCRWFEDTAGFWLCLKVQPKFKKAVQEFVSSFKDKLHVADIKQYRERRSLDANAYMWVLLGRIAEVLRTDKDSVYIEMLSRYGVYTHIVVKPGLVERIKGEWRTVRELGEVTINGTLGIQLQCYFGSHTYDTKEMARLIDGVVSECKELDIETATPEELARIKEQWKA